MLIAPLATIMPIVLAYCAMQSIVAKQSSSNSELYGRNVVVVPESSLVHDDVGRLCRL